MKRWLRIALISLAAVVSLQAVLGLTESLVPVSPTPHKPVMRQVGHTLVFRCFEPQPGLPRDCRGTSAEWAARLKRD
jgi:hypothetical protein